MIRCPCLWPTIMQSGQPYNEAWAERASASWQWYNWHNPWASGLLPNGSTSVLMCDRHGHPITFWHLVQDSILDAMLVHARKWHTFPNLECRPYLSLWETHTSCFDICRVHACGCTFLTSLITISSTLIWPNLHYGEILTAAQVPLFFACTNLIIIKTPKITILDCIYKWNG